MNEKLQKLQNLNQVFFNNNNNYNYYYYYYCYYYYYYYYFLLLLSAVFIALMLVGPSKCLKQIIQMKLNRVKNPNWLEADQLVIYKRGRGFELVTTCEQIQQAVRAGLDLGASELQVQRSNRAASLPPTGRKLVKSIDTFICIEQSHILTFRLKLLNV